MKKYLLIILSISMLQVYVHAAPLENTTTTLSKEDNWIGWSWNGQTASYIALLYGRPTLIVRPFDGINMGLVKAQLKMSEENTFRAWNWDGEIASYVAILSGQTYLIIRPFDGERFSPVTKKIKLSIGDTFRGWSWDGKVATYVAVFKGKLTMFVRDFDGNQLGTIHAQVEMEEIQPTMRAINIAGPYSCTVYFDEKTGETKLNHKKFTIADLPVTRISQTVLDRNLVPSDPILTTEGKLMKFNLSEKRVNLIGEADKVGELEINNVVQAAYFSSEKFTYVFVDLKGISINIPESVFLNRERIKGYYIKQVEVEIWVPGFDEFRSNPKNLNQSGTYTTSEALSVGIGVSNTGTEANVGYTWGSSFSEQVTDFEFEKSASKEQSKAGFTWYLAKLKNGERYTSFYSLGNRAGGQYESLSELPALARSNFPIECNGIFRKPTRSSVEIPTNVRVNVRIKTTFEECSLDGWGRFGAQAFFEGFGALFNPKTYSGELLYQFNHDVVIIEENLITNLDLSALK
ncbi:MAG: hypothetical protein AAF705_16965 [Bacteroidota bacterium]